MSVFDRVFAYVVRPDVEGALSLDPGDKGNWTGGAVGKGELRGTKYGISASSYPTLNIGALSLADSRAIFQRDYWSAARCDAMPDEVAFVLFDAAVQHSPHFAVMILQRSLKVTEDGIAGPHTIFAARAANEDELVIDFQARRILAYVKLPTWSDFGHGWAVRDIRTAIAALR